MLWELLLVMAFYQSCKTPENLIQVLEGHAQSTASARGRGAPSTASAS